MILPVTKNHSKRPLLTLLIWVFSVSATLATAPSVAVQPINTQAASIKVELSPPNFTFELNTVLAPINDVKLAPNEFNLSKNIKPLLSEKKYLQVLALLEANENKKSDALLLMTGQVYLAAKQPKKAEQSLLSVLKNSPNLVAAHRTLAALYLQEKQLKKAQHHLSASIKNGVQDPQFFGQLAYINLNENSPWSAISGYQQALLLEPNNSQWKHGLLYALQRAGNNQAALNMVDELINATPTDKKLWLQRAQITLATNDHAKALTSMEMALRYGEKKPNNLLSTAQLHLAQGSMARSADLLIKIISKNPQAFEQIEPVITWLISEEEYQQASRILTSIKGVNKLSRNQQSLYYATLGSTKEPSSMTQAIKHFKKSLDLNPNQASVLIKLAQHYQKNQQFSRAQLYFQRAQIFPQFTKQSLAGLAQLALDQQQYTQAIDYLEKLKNLSVHKHNIEKNISIIKRLKTQQS